MWKNTFTCDLASRICSFEFTIKMEKNSLILRKTTFWQTKREKIFLEKVTQHGLQNSFILNLIKRNKKTNLKDILINGKFLKLKNNIYL